MMHTDRPLDGANGQNRTFAIGVIGACVFVALASLQLSAQGLYQDEAHQAVGSFALRHGESTWSGSLRIGSLPLLNMRYSAAIKTNLFGTYLAYTGAPFSITEWRMLGILFFAIGLVVFAWLTRSVLPPRIMIIFVVLLVSDGTMFLGSRHDWGPIALATLIRLAIAGIWLRGLREEHPPTPRSSFAMACLVGLAVFEKLSSFVLLVPLLLFWLGDQRRRDKAHSTAVVAGVAVGSIPLFIINLIGYVKQGVLVSLADVDLTVPIPFSEFVQHYLSLGAGLVVRKRILGDTAGQLSASIETWLLGTLLIAAAAYATWSWRTHRPLSRCMKFSLLSAAAYVGIGVVLYFMPRSTWAHHWILGTPFQYLAMVLAIQSLPTASPLKPDTWSPAWIATIVLALVWAPVRTERLLTLQGALARGESSEHYHPDLNELGRYGAGHDEAHFAAASWGVAFPIVCFSNGRRGMVREYFWNYDGLATVEAQMKRHKKRVLYLVSLQPGNIMPQFDRTTDMERDLGSSAAWSRPPLPPQLSKLDGLRISRYELGAPL
jgi:hypothetical protein